MAGGRGLKRRGHLPILLQQSIGGWSTVVANVASRDSERGASSVEYGLLAALIAGAIVIAVVAFGGLTGDLFSGSCDTVNSGIQSTGQPAVTSC
jgi:pilus assembly protein Flp/PilA